VVVVRVAVDVHVRIRRGDQEHTVRGQDACQLVERACGRLDVLDAFEAHHRVERIAGER
jgi:hypothetical protein